jgi:hypothetical protein
VHVHNHHFARAQLRQRRAKVGCVIELTENLRIERTESDTCTERIHQENNKKYLGVTDGGDQHGLDLTGIVLHVNHIAAMHFGVKVIQHTALHKDIVRVRFLQRTNENTRRSKFQPEAWIGLCTTRPPNGLPGAVP